MPTVINAAGSTPLAHPLSTFSVLVDGAGVLTNDGAGNLTWSAGGEIFQDIIGIVKSEASGNISAATAGTDYLAFGVQNLGSLVLAAPDVNDDTLVLEAPYPAPGAYQAISFRYGSEMGPEFDFHFSEIRNIAGDNSGGTIELWSTPNDNSQVVQKTAEFSTTGAVIVGDISAANLSGTNTGDQDLSGYALTSSLGTAAFAATGDFDAAGAAAAITFGTLGASTIGTAIVGLTNPGAITFLRANADNTASLLSASDFRTAIGAGTSSFSGAYADLSGKPTLGSAAAAATTDFDPAGAAAAVTPATLGLVIGTNVQAYDADLTTWAGVTPGTGVTAALAVNTGSAGSIVVTDGSNRLPALDGSQLTGISAGLSRGKIMAAILTA